MVNRTTLMSRAWAWFCLSLLALLLAACGGKSSDSNNAGTTDSRVGPQPTMTLAFDQSAVVLTKGRPAVLLTVTVKDATGNPKVNTPVEIRIDPVARASSDKPNGTLTDATGVATFSVSPGEVGLGLVTATASQVAVQQDDGKGNVTKTALTKGLNFNVVEGSPASKVSLKIKDGAQEVSKLVAGRAYTLEAQVTDLKAVAIKDILIEFVLDSATTSNPVPSNLKARTDSSGIAKLTFVATNTTGAAQAVVAYVDSASGSTVGQVAAYEVISSPSTVTVQTVTIELVDSKGVVAKSLSLGGTYSAKVTAKNSDGTDVQDALISLSSTNPAILSFPSTAMLDAKGTALLPVTPTKADEAAELKVSLRGKEAVTTFAVIQGGGAGVQSKVALTIKDGSGPVKQLKVGQAYTVEALVTDISVPAKPLADVLVTFALDAETTTNAVPSNLKARTDATGLAKLTFVANTTTGAAQSMATIADSVTGRQITQLAAYEVVSSPSSVAVQTVTVQLLDKGVPTKTLTLGGTYTAKITAKNSDGSDVKEALISLSATNPAILSFSTTAMTGTDGTASLSVTPLLADQAAELKARVGGKEGVTTFAVTKASGLGGSKYLDLTNVKIGSTPIAFDANGVQTTAAPVLNPYDTTTISASLEVVDNATTPPTRTKYSTGLNVNFTSSCLKNVPQRAMFKQDVQAVSGDVTTTYRDNGCANIDAVTISVPNLTDKNGLPLAKVVNLRVTPPPAKSLQFVSSAPNKIFLLSTGGVNTALIKFKVVDQQNNPVPSQPVGFYLAGAGGSVVTTGGARISATTGRTDENGEVAVSVTAGYVAIPIRVIAAAKLDVNNTPATEGDDVSVEVSSSELSISTGLPTQRNFSLSASTFNIEGLAVDGTTTTVTIRAADHFNNPVPDNTTVNFIASGGAIEPSCLTKDGACSVRFVSQRFNPASGRVNIFAYARGEEAFRDNNQNGTYDGGVDNYDDVPLAFQDVAELGYYIPSGSTYVDDAGVVQNAFKGERFFDIDATKTSYPSVFAAAIYTTATNVGNQGKDGKYNGSVRTVDLAAPPQIYVYANLTLVLSGSSWNTATSGLSAFNNFVTSCSGRRGSTPTPGVGRPSSLSFPFRIVDALGNVLPAATAVFASTKGGVEFVASSPDKVENQNTRREVLSVTTPYIVQIKVKLKTIEGVELCDSEPGMAIVKTSTPLGVTTGYSISEQP